MGEQENYENEKKKQKVYNGVGRGRRREEKMKHKIQKFDDAKIKKWTEKEEENEKNRSIINEREREGTTGWRGGKKNEKEKKYEKREGGRGGGERQKKIKEEKKVKESFYK